MDPLEMAVLQEVQQGARVLHRGPGYVVITTGKPVNHILHALLSLLTCGLWLVVWLAVLVFGQKERRFILRVDPETGQIRKDHAFNY